MIEAIAIELITLHMLDGRVVQINPEQVTQVLHTVDSENKTLVEGVNCVVKFVDGSFLSVVETCKEIEALIEERK